MVIAHEDLRGLVGATPDPELDPVTIAELGILRDLVEDDGRLTVCITPTYAGCPAMDVIADTIRRRLAAVGVEAIDIEYCLDPPWTSDWISKEGRQKLEAMGIGPPTAADAPPDRLLYLRSRRDSDAVLCPRCGNADTVQTARFGPTPCTSLWRCTRCSEPFEAIKVR